MNNIEEYGTCRIAVSFLDVPKKMIDVTKGLYTDVLVFADVRPSPVA
jgi:hypothetical protein